MIIRSILVSALAPFENHMANGGEKAFGNASTIKRTPNGRAYVSGQKQRHALFAALNRLNDADPNKGATYVSNGDGVTPNLKDDLRADLGGFMIPSVNNKRMSPISATFGIALAESKVGRDLLVRLARNKEANVKATQDNANKQALATREYSEHDEMHMNFSLDLTEVGVRVEPRYKDKLHVASEVEEFIDEAERLRRVRLFLQATNSLTDYANQARNAVCAEPQKVLIVIDNKLSRKAMRYFTAAEVEKERILSELNERGAKYYLGDDTSAESGSVAQAYAEALKFIEDEANALYKATPSGG